MWYNFKIECQRYLQEMLNFKFNLLFANIGLILFFNGLSTYANIQNKEIVFLLFILWYFATHGFINIEYIIEEEITDGTFAHVLMSNTSFLYVIFMRCVIQVIYDFLKAVIVFGILLSIGNYDFQWISFPTGILIIFLIIIGISISYFFGLMIGSLALKYKKISAIPSLFYYFVLFFAGILYDVSKYSFLNSLSYLLPFLPIKNILYSLQNHMIVSNTDILCLSLQFILYLCLGIFLYKKYLKEILKTGSVFYV